MATTRANGTTTAATSTSDSALTPEVRRRLKSTVLELRHLVEDDFRRQLVAVAVIEEGVKPLAAGRVLPDEQKRVRDTAVAMLKREVAGGASPAEAYATLLRESVFTFLNRAIGLRCLEARGLLMVDGQTETAITQQEELGGIPSLYWRVRNSPGAPSQPREIWRETYRRACAAVSRDIRVLFDPQAEYAALFPLLPAMQRVVEALNDPMIPAAAYAEDAVLGWVYQYFQSEEKDRIFAEVRSKKKKIGGADIIPVTQLYTEQYMVDFLLQNSLGRTWMEMYPESPAKAAWPYYVEPATPHSRPRKPLRDWTILDPCVGSGHFLVVAFDLLAQLYAEERRMGEAGAIPLEETVAPEDVPLTILERNLYGIDIDRRATQIATLALYLKARQAGLSRSPRVNIVAADASYLQGEAWERFLAGFQKEPSVRRVLAATAGYLKDIRELGSLLRPEEELKRLIAEEHKRWENAGRPEQAGLFPEYESPRQKRLAFEQIDEDDQKFWEQLAYRAEAAIQGFYDLARDSDDLDEQIVAGEAQRGFAFLELCQRRYDVVCTNPPYMGSKNMAIKVKSWIAANYPPAKRDIYACFMVRCCELVHLDAYVGMVTQHGWMFLNSFTRLRGSLLADNALVSVAHLGAKTFLDLSNSNAMGFTMFVVRHNSDENYVSACFRLVHEIDKQSSLLEAVNNFNQDKYGHSYKAFATPWRVFEAIPGFVLFYWAPEGIQDTFLESRALDHFVEPRQGIATADNPRFLRLYWELQAKHIGRRCASRDEALRSCLRWFPYMKGGPFCRWYGNLQYLIDWHDDGRDIRAFPKAVIRNPNYFFQAGGTWTEQTSYGFSVRYMPPGCIFDVTGPAFFLATPECHLNAMIALANTKVIQFVFTALQPTVHFGEGYFSELPAPDMSKYAPLFSVAGHFAINVKRSLCSWEVTEFGFTRLVVECRSSADSPATSLLGYDSILAKCAIVHAMEGLNEKHAVTAYQLSSEDIPAVVAETGTPAGWHPLLAGYDALPDLPANLPPVPQELTDYLTQHERVALALEQLARLKDSLRALYVAGPGAKVDVEAADDAGKNGNGEDDDEEGSVSLGARIPIPTETFLEELSQKLEVHPISVYWLLEEMRRDEGLVCRPEMKRQMEDYASVTLLRELGFRWPEQDAYEAEHGPILDPALVVPDGILPLVDCGAGTTAAQHLRLRLERDFGEEGAAESEAEFRKWVGRPLDDWLRRDFFKRHIQQFKQRPIAWHFVSPQKTFEAFVLYHKLCDESTGIETLRALRTQYAGGLITRLRAEQERARAARDEREVTRLQLAIEDVEEFRERLERIERGDNGDLKARIRCRWKGDEAKVGRPGPYAPDINDGVKVNVRPFQELALLAAPVIKKWD